MSDLQQKFNALLKVNEQLLEANKELADALEQQAAVIEQMREALNISSAAIKLAGWEGDFAYTNAKTAELLQPCPEVLNKVRADAVRKFHSVVLSMDGVPVHALDYADRIEKGEA